MTVPATQFRMPLLRILADGVTVPGALSAEVTTTNHYAADRYSARLALAADPAGLAGWDAREGATMQVQIGLDPGGWTTLLTGRIDRLEADPVAGLVRIEGRDLSAGLIEARTREAFANQTASDIATLLAGRHGLAAQVSATATPVGRYYGADHDRLTLDRHARASTEWDLLVWLAQQEGFDVFVTGSSLYFQPPPQTGAARLVLQPVAVGGVPANVSALRVQHEVALAGDMAVTVKSWNSQTQTATVQTAQSSAAAAGTGSARNYVFVHPNLHPDAALQMAQRKLAALGAHEYALEAAMPGELVLAARDNVTLSGTQSSFDRDYTVDEICRRIDARRGFVQTLRARSAGSI